MAARQESKPAIKNLDSEISVQDQPSQSKRPDSGQFRLLVDRQTKGSYPTSEAAEQAGFAIKQGFPLVQVTVYDSTAGTNKVIEAPNHQA